jgi:hypothetical protein
MTHWESQCKKCKVKYWYQASGHGSFDELNDSNYCPICKEAKTKTLWYRFKQRIEFYYYQLRSLCGIGIKVKLPTHDELGIQPMSDHEYDCPFSNLKVTYKKDKE